VPFVLDWLIDPSVFTLKRQMVEDVHISLR
jgi:hypothetical protein